MAPGTKGGAAAGATQPRASGGAEPAAPSPGVPGSCGAPACGLGTPPGNGLGIQAAGHTAAPSPSLLGPDSRGSSWLVACAHSHTLTHSHSHTRTHTLTHTLTRSLTHTHARAPAHTRVRATHTCTSSCLGSPRGDGGWTRGTQVRNRTSGGSRRTGPLDGIGVDVCKWSTGGWRGGGEAECSPEVGRTQEGLTLSVE